jgi:hypothetical protein
MRRIDIGGRITAEGQFTWLNGDGRELFVRGLALLAGGLCTSYRSVARRPNSTR